MDKPADGTQNYISLNNGKNIITMTDSQRGLNETGTDSAD